MVKFLIIRLSSFSDILFSTPLIRGLKEQVEDSEIHFLTREQEETLLLPNPYISKVHLLSSNYHKLITNLKHEEFDYVIDLQNNFQSFRIKNSLHRFSFSVKSQKFREWFYIHFKIKKLSLEHIVHRYLATGSTFSVEDDRKGLDIFIPEADELDLKKEYPEILKEFTAVVVGGGPYTRQIPVEKLAGLLDRIQSDIVLLGETKDLAKTIKLMQITSHSRVFNLVSKLSFFQSASLIKQATSILTNDSDLMHIAAALGKPVFSVWGNTVPAFGSFPFQPAQTSKMMEVNGLKCRPCAKNGFAKCPKKHFRCMMDQDYKNLSDTINLIIRANRE